jgi:hypothetical protein
MPDTTETPQQITDIVRHENFESWYANNVQFYPTQTDLKLVFGEMDWPTGKPIIQQHTAMTVTWLQAKIMHYFLVLQLGIYEMQNGKIAVPPALFPPEPQPPSEEDLKGFPQAMQVYEFVKKAREQFIASQG